MTITIIILILMILVLTVCIGKIALAYFVDELQETKRQNSLKKEYEEEKAKEAKEKADFEALPKAQREKILKQEKKLKAEQAREREERIKAKLKLLKKGRMYLIYLSHERTSGGWRSRAGKFIGFTPGAYNKAEPNLVFNTAEGTVVANIDYDEFQPIEKEREIK